MQSVRLVFVSVVLFASRRLVVAWCSSRFRVVIVRVRPSAAPQISCLILSIVFIMCSLLLFVLVIHFVIKFLSTLFAVVVLSALFICLIS